MLCHRCSQPCAASVAAAVQTTPDGQPQFMCLRQQPFTSEELAIFATRSIAPSATVVSDGLWCFGAVRMVGAAHDQVVTGGGKASTTLASTPSMQSSPLLVTCSTITHVPLRTTK